MLDDIIYVPLTVLEIFNNPTVGKRYITTEQYSDMYWIVHVNTDGLHIESAPGSINDYSASYRYNSNMGLEFKRWASIWEIKEITPN